jgi:hypothetical protein
MKPWARGFFLALSLIFSVMISLPAHAGPGDASLARLLSAVNDSGGTLTPDGVQMILKDPNALLTSHTKVRSGIYFPQTESIDKAPFIMGLIVQMSGLTREDAPMIYCKLHQDLCSTKYPEYFCKQHPEAASCKTPVATPPTPSASNPPAPAAPPATPSGPQTPATPPASAAPNPPAPVAPTTPATAPEAASQTTPPDGMDTTPPLLDPSGDQDQDETVAEGPDAPQEPDADQMEEAGDQEQPEMEADEQEPELDQVEETSDQDQSDLESEDQTDSSEESPQADEDTSRSSRSYHSHSPKQVQRSQNSTPSFSFRMTPDGKAELVDAEGTTLSEGSLSKHNGLTVFFGKSKTGETLLLTEQGTGMIASNGQVTVFDPMGYFELKTDKNGDLLMNDDQGRTFTGKKNGAGQMVITDPESNSATIVDNTAFRIADSTGHTILEGNLNKIYELAVAHYGNAFPHRMAAGPANP